MRVDVVRQGRLVKPVEAKSRFVYPTSARDPDPAASRHLSAGMDLRPPERLQLRKIFDGSSVISEEIHPADTMALIEPVIYLADKVFNPDLVVKSVRDADALIVIKGKAFTITVHGCARESAACNL